MTRALLLVPWPISKPHGGVVRVKSFAQALRASGVDVVLATPTRPAAEGSSAGRGSWRRELFPVPFARIGPDPRSLKTVVERLDSAEWGFILSFQVHSYLAASVLSEESPLWLDEMDIVSDYAGTANLGRGAIRRVTGHAQAVFLRRLERRCRSAARVVTAAGHSDWRSLQRQQIVAEWLPTPVSAPSFRKGFNGTIRTVGFLGNMAYPPNRIAAELLSSKWAPAFAAMGIEVVVAGFESERLESLPGCRVLGTLPTPQDFYDIVDCAIVPVNEGGGIKVKAAEALVYGCPVITSLHVLDGLGLADTSAVEVCADADGLRESIERLLSRRDSWESTYEDATNRYSPAALERRVSAIVADRLL